MVDEMYIPEEMKEKIFEIIMAKVPPEKMEEAIQFMIDTFNKQETDDNKYGSIMGVMYGILGFGYYLGGYDAVESMVDMIKQPTHIDRNN